MAWGGNMKGMFEKVKKVDRFGIIRGLVVFCIITVSVFFLIRHNTYKQTLSYYQGTLSNQTNITTSQLDETMQNNLQYLYNAANIIGEYSSFRSEEAIQRLFGLEDGSIFSELYILYNDGTLIDCEGQEVQAESTLVSGIFQEAAGFTIIQDPGDVSGALLYVPIVEGKSQLLGTIDISYLNKKVSMFASPEVS